MLLRSLIADIVNKMKKYIIAFMVLVFSLPVSAMWFSRTSDEVFADASAKWNTKIQGIIADRKEFLLDWKDVSADKYKEASESSNVPEMERLNTQLIEISNELRAIDEGRETVSFLVAQ